MRFLLELSSALLSADCHIKQQLPTAFSLPLKMVTAVLEPVQVRTP
ncbi:hypothetical protein [Pseudomonas sp. NFIX28]|nr:hypothetical protein [Pseudomonas sp. NFIX28]